MNWEIGTFDSLIVINRRWYVEPVVTSSPFSPALMLTVFFLVRFTCVCNCVAWYGSKVTRAKALKGQLRSKTELGFKTRSSLSWLGIELTLTVQTI